VDIEVATQPARAKSVRRLIKSVNDTLKGASSTRGTRHGGRTVEVAVRVAQRILARAAAIRHNRETGAPVLRSLTAFEH
jgi:hypothetical protein